MRASMPLHQWPAADQAMWCALHRAGGVFDDRGPFALIRDSTIKIRRNAYGRWLEWLRRTDPSLLHRAPEARATLETFKAFAKSHSHLAASSQAMFATGVIAVLQAARPEVDWAGHLRVTKGLARKASQTPSSRKQGRVLCSRTLLDAGIRHAQPEAGSRLTPLQQAVRQRDGTMIAFLALIPIRHRAFTGLVIGQSLLVSGHRLTIALPEDLTKSGTPWEADVPEPLAGLLHAYLETSRAFLLTRSGQCHDTLWVNNNGTPMSYPTVGRKVPDITERLTGVRIPPHFFRDAAATTLARTSTQAARVIAPVLGHNDHRTAERHYIQAGSIEAGRDYAELLRRVRARR